MHSKLNFFKAFRKIIKAAVTYQKNECNNLKAISFTESTLADRDTKRWGMGHKLVSHTIPGAYAGLPIPGRIGAFKRAVVMVLEVAESDLLMLLRLQLNESSGYCRKLETRLNVARQARDQIIE